MPASILKDYLNKLVDLFSTINYTEFEEFIKELTEAYQRKSNIFICGNGGSASTASHFACDINKGVSFGQNKRFRVICLNDNIPTLLAYANDISYDDIFIEQLKNFMNENDLVIGISGSGNSENIIRAIKYGNKHGGRTFGICGFNGGELKGVAKKSLTIGSNDMQKIEDMHLILIHCAMQWFNIKNQNDNI